MGADLYVVGMDEGAQVACGFEVSIKAAKVGYFRDPYNEHGLFRQIGLSWWQLCEAYKGEEQMTAEYVLKPEFVDNFAKTVEQAFKKSEAKDKVEYVRWMGVFRQFILTAKEVGKGIMWSV